MTETEIGVEVAHGLEADRGAVPGIDQGEAIDEVVHEREEATGAVRERERDPVLGKDEDHVQERGGDDHDQEKGGEGHMREDDQGQETESKSDLLETERTDKDYIFPLTLTFFPCNCIHVVLKLILLSSL